MTRKNERPRKKRTIDDALLQDIIEHPDDDTPRLAFADRREEEGGSSAQARAEFLRLQIQIANLPKGDQQLPALRRREAELVNRYGGTWAAALGLERSEVRFVRGFVEEVQLTFARYLKCAKRLGSQTPLRVLKLIRNRGRMHRLATCPHLASVSSLILAYGEMDDGDATLLAECPYVANLKTLVASNNPLSAEGVESLLSSPYLQGCEIRFGGNLLGAEGGAMLARSPALAHYTLLDLDNTELGNDGLVALLKSPYLTNIVEFRLRGCHIGDDGIRALIQAHLPALRRIDLGRNDLGNAEMVLLAGSDLLRQLTHVDVSSNHIGNDGARALAGSANTAQLEVLSVVYNPIGEQGMQALRNSSSFRKDISLRLEEEARRAVNHVIDEEEEEVEVEVEEEVEEDKFEQPKPKKGKKSADDEEEEEPPYPHYDQPGSFLEDDWRMRFRPRWDRRAW